MNTAPQQLIDEALERHDGFSLSVPNAHMKSPARVLAPSGFSGSFYRTVSRGVVLTIAWSAFGACIPLPGGRSLGSQTVTAKSGADILVASQGDTCRVSPAVFETVRIGESHKCVWTLANGGEGVKTNDRLPTGKTPSVARPKVPPPSP